MLGQKFLAAQVCRPSGKGPSNRREWARSWGSPWSIWPAGWQ